MDKIQIHGIAFSTYTRTARMAAIELGVDHALVPIAYGKPSHFALHPFGKMPAMTDGGTTVFETLAIISYLSDKARNPTLMGTSAEERAKILTTISVAIDYAYRPVVHIETADGIASSEDLDKAAVPLDWLEDQLAQHAFIVGEGLTAADLFFAPMVAYRAQQVGEAVAHTGRPKTKAWMGTIAARPSFATTGAE